MTKQKMEYTVRFVRAGNGTKLAELRAVADSASDAAAICREEFESENPHLADSYQIAAVSGKTL